jgi:glucose-1-phosphate adenylyltransferase
MAYLFNGYWEDIGTIESFFNANLALTHNVSARVCVIGS